MIPSARKISRRNEWLVAIAALLCLSLAVVVGLRLPAKSGAGENAAPPPAPNPQSPVWVDMRTGLYYCNNSSMYEQLSPGEGMSQGQARRKSFRPAFGRSCN